MNDPFEALKGNETQKEYFAAQIAAGALSHAYILEGEEGTGRHTLARAVACRLAGDPAECDKIRRGICQDVMTFGVPRDKKFFPVDVVRRIKSEAYILPGELSFRFFILENSEMMNAQAQNAALKLLEEPPGSTYFFLLCENAAALLPTVRSRAPVIRMQRFSPEELKRMLQSDPAARAADSSAERLEAAVKSSGGSYGKALAALTKNRDDEQDEQIRAVLLCLGAPSRAELIPAVLALPQKRQEFDAALASLQTALRDMLRVRCGGKEEDLFWFSDLKEAKKYAARLTKDAILAMYERTSEVRAQAQMNVNMQNAALALANRLYAAAQR